MKRMIWFVLVLITICLMGVSTASAWEFTMKGDFEWRFRYFGRLGGYNDLFGNMLLQDAGGPMMGFAGPSYYGKGAVKTGPANNAGVVRLVRGGFSESDSDAHLNDQRLTLYPSIRVNKAVHFTGVLTFGGYRNKYYMSGTDPDGSGDFPFGGVGVPPFERYYMDRTSVNAFDTAAIPSLEQWKLTLQTPVAVFSIGIKDFPIGVGATLGKNTRASSLLLVVPYGPLRLMGAWWPGRTRFTEGYDASPDGAEKNQFHGSFVVTYTAGPIETGWLGLWRTHHSNAYEGGGTALDDFTDIEVAYLKYNNGRFFFNAEYAHVNIDRRRVGAGPTYFRDDHQFGELGAYFGPAKISLVAFRSSGPVSPGAADFNPTKARVGLAINSQAMEPYEWLMFRTYGGGNNGGWSPATVPVTNDQDGQAADAYGFGGRIDYAVASNLNIYGTYLWAHRTEQNGYLAGSTASTGGAGINTVAAAQTWKAANLGGVANQLNPYVDDGFIGWEMNLGVDWKILEATTLHFRWAYWQPGEWFDQAYQAVAYRGGAVVDDGLLIGRDPINAFEGTLAVNF